MCRIMSFTKFGKFSVFISSNVLSIPSPFISLPRALMSWILGLSFYFWESLKLHLPFIIYFSVCFTDWINSIVVISCPLFFFLLSLHSTVELILPPTPGFSSFYFQNYNFFFFLLRITITSLISSVFLFTHGSISIMTTLKIFASEL